ncbi:MAG: prepilin-type N-terminal cleavage/methylation domain-containing protein [Candidatus Acidiferrales bacterium]
MFEKSHNSSAAAANDRRRGFSLIELLIVVAIILIIAAIAIPNLLRARMAANQASGLSNLRTVTSASITYWSTYQNGYPPNLATLGGLGVANCNGALLLDETLTVPPYRKSGYELDYQPQGSPITNSPLSCGSPGFSEYLTTAVPVSVGSTGNTSYCSNEPGVIHFDTAGAKAASQAACAALPTLQ